MTANLIASHAVSDNELCQANLKQRKQLQVQCYSRGVEDLDSLKEECSKTKTISAGQVKMGESNFSGNLNISQQLDDTSASKTTVLTPLHYFKCTHKQRRTMRLVINV